MKEALCFSAPRFHVYAWTGFPHPRRGPQLGVIFEFGVDHSDAYYPFRGLHRYTTCERGNNGKSSRGDLILFSRTLTFTVYLHSNACGRILTVRHAFLATNQRKFLHGSEIRKAAFSASQFCLHGSVFYREYCYVTLFFSKMKHISILGKTSTDGSVSAFSRLIPREWGGCALGVFL